jgi:phenylalanyl-tRNA synthetase alpha chain
MQELLNQINQYKIDISSYTAKTADDVEAFRIKYLGTKGIVKGVMGEMKNVPNENKKEIGLVLNAFKIAAEERYEALKEQLTSADEGSASDIDLSLPGDPIPVGTRHPLSVVRNQMVSIFKRLGFAVAEGPEMEDDWHNFTALNLPEDHPARDMQDTFYLNRNPDYLLRTHTSSVQARIMEKQKPPIRIVCPGRVYRNETISARAHCFFHQVEGLYVDEHVSFFPFTEPSAEMDISCTVCGGVGCNLCKHTGWVEILGCGMVHPKLLENFNIDPNKYTGFAFGMGVERICQLKFRVNDLRLYSQNDIRFLRQFTGAV